MAVQWDSKNGLTTWLDVFKTKLPEVSKELKSCFTDIEDAVKNGEIWNTELMVSYAKDCRVCTNDLEKFFSTVDNSKNISTQYQQWMIANGKATSTFASFTKKAGNVLKSFVATLGSMAVNWAISEAIGFVVTKVYELANAAKITEEKAREFSQSLKNFNAEISKNSSTINGLNSEYQRLSKGVDSLGRNVSLTSDEYDRYKEIVSQISDIMPDLTAYYDAQGKKIAFVKGNLQDLNKEYEEHIQLQARRFISEGDEDGNTVQDVLNNYNNNFKDKSTLEQTGVTLNHLFGNYSLDDVPVKEMISHFEKLLEMSQEELNKYLSSSIFEETFAWTDDFERYFNSFYGVSSNTSDKYMNRIIRDVFDISPSDLEKMSSESFDMLRAQFQSQFQLLQQEFEIDKSGLTDVLLTFFHASDSYLTIEDETVKTQISTFLSSVTSDLWDELDIEGTDIGFSTFVNKIIDAFENNESGLSKAWDGLFSIDETLPLDEYNAQVKKYIDVILENLNLSDFDEEAKLRFTVGLGFDFVASEASREGLKNKLKQSGAIAGYSKFVQDIENKTMDEWANSLSHSDIQLANSDEFQDCLDAEKAKLDGAAISADTYSAALKELKKSKNISDGTENSFLTEDQNEVLTTFQSNLSSITTLLSALSSNTLTAAQQLELLQLAAKIDPNFELELYRAAHGTLNFSDILEHLASYSMRAAIEKCPELSHQIHLLGDSLGTSIGIAREAISEVHKLSAEYDEIEAVLKRVQNGEVLTAEEVAVLVNKHGELANSIQIVNGGFSLEEKALKSLADSFTSTSNQAIAKAIESTKVTIEQIKNRLKGYRAEIKALDTLYKYYENDPHARQKVAEATENATEGMTKEQKKKVTDLQNPATKAGKDYADLTNAEKELDYLEGELDQIPTGSGSSSSSSSGTNSANAKDSFKGTIDWVNESLDQINRKLDLAESKLTNAKVSGVRLDTQLKYYDAVIEAQEKVTEGYKKATDAYKDDFNAKLKAVPKEYREAIKAGNKFEIEDFDTKKDKNAEKNYNAVVAAQEAYEKYQSAYSNWYESAAKEKEATTQKFEAVQEWYQLRLTNISGRANSVQQEIDLLEAKGSQVSEAYYRELIHLQDTSIGRLEKEKKTLEEILNSGDVQPYTEQWYEMVSAIQEINSQIVDANKNIVEFEQAIRQLSWDNFDKLIGKFDSLIDESDFLIGLMSDKDMIDDKGELTSEGLTTSAQHAYNYDVKMAEAQEHLAEANKYLNATDEESIRYREEQLKLQRECIQATNQEKEAIVSLAKEGIQKQIDLMQEYIDKRKEALDAEEDFYEYQKSIAKKNKDIASIQKALIALAGDDSEEAKKKKRELRAELKEAQEELNDTIRQHSIEEQKKALDEVGEKYTKSKEEEMKNTEALFEKMMEKVNAGTESISETLQKVASDVGYSISTNILEVWKKSGQAVADFASGFTSKSVGVLKNLESIKKQWEEVAKAANEAAIEQLKAMDINKTTSGIGDTGTQANGYHDTIVNLLNDSSNFSSKQVTKDDSGYKNLSKLNQSLVKAGYHNLSYEGMSKLASLFGIFATADEIKNSTKLKDEILKAIKAEKIPGFSTGGVVNLKQQTGEDGIALLSKGEGVLTEEQVQMFKQMAKIPPANSSAFISQMIPSIGSLISALNEVRSMNMQSMIPELPTQNSVTISDGAFTFHIEGVTNTDDFVRELQNDKRIRKAVQEAALGESLGHGRLNINRI